MQTYIRVLGLMPAALDIVLFIGPQKTSKISLSWTNDSSDAVVNSCEVCVTLCLRLCCQL